jgi:hypothetical protein
VALEAVVCAPKALPDVHGHDGAIEQRDWGRGELLRAREAHPRRRVEGNDVADRAAGACDVLEDVRFSWARLRHPDERVGARVAKSRPDVPPSPDPAALAVGRRLEEREGLAPSWGPDVRSGRTGSRSGASCET